jgi:hypothetical protein
MYKICNTCTRYAVFCSLLKICMSDIYARTRPYHVNINAFVMLYIDRFPERIDWRRSHRGSDISGRIPRSLRQPSENYSIVRITKHSQLLRVHYTEPNERRYTEGGQWRLSRCLVQKVDVTLVGFQKTKPVLLSRFIWQQTSRPADQQNQMNTAINTSSTLSPSSSSYKRNPT